MDREQLTTMVELCEIHLREGVDAKKASTLKLDRIRIERHIKPRIGRMRVRDITDSDLQRLVRDVAAA